MFPILDRKELELHPIDFAEEFQPNAIDLGADARQLTPIRDVDVWSCVEELTASTR